jgi:hypothetical protein
MSSPTAASFVTAFAQAPDPRRAQGRRFRPDVEGAPPFSANTTWFATQVATRSACSPGRARSASAAVISSSVR